MSVMFLVFTSQITHSREREVGERILAIGIRQYVDGETELVIVNVCWEDRVDCA